MTGILDLLRMRQMSGMMPASPAFGAGGVLGALNFPQVDPRLLQGNPFATPAAANAPAPTLPGGMPPVRPPQFQNANWLDSGGDRGGRGGAANPPIAAPQTPATAAPTPQPRNAPAPITPPAAPAEHDTLDPLPALHDLSPAPPALAQPHTQRGGIGGFLDRLNAPMGQSALTPLDGLSLGMQFMGAGEASWNVDQPSGWSRAGDAVSQTMDRAQDRSFRDEQRQAFRNEQQRADASFRHDQGEWGRTDQMRAATARAIAAMPPGPERDWAEANPDDYARIAMAQAAQSGEQTVSDGFVWTRGPNGELTRGDEVPLTAAQRAENQTRLAAIAHQNDPERLTPSGRQQVLSAVTNSNVLNQAVQRVSELLRGASPADLRIGGPHYAQLMSAYTHLDYLLKGPEMYALGALSGNDLRGLQAVVGDPSNFEQFVRDGGGIAGLQARIAEVQRNVDYTRQQLYARYSDAQDQFPAHTFDDFTPRPPAVASDTGDMPDPAENMGRTIEDPETGQRMRSDGRRWIPVEPTPSAAPPASAYRRPDGPMTRG